MAESDSERRQQILDAALRVFSTQGFHEATIKQIAAEAGLKSPSLIYWYFKDKHELLRAVLARAMPLISQISDPAAVAQLIERPPEEMLLMVATMFLNVFQHPDAVRLFRIFISEAIRSPDVINPFTAHGPAIVLDFLSGYLQHQIELGALRPHDPNSSARSFMGMLLVYVLGRTLIPRLGTGLPEPEQYAQDVVAIFLQGLQG